MGKRHNQLIKQLQIFWELHFFTIVEVKLG
jgi:hypothetical protein